MLLTSTCFHAQMDSRTPWLLSYRSSVLETSAPVFFLMHKPGNLLQLQKSVMSNALRGISFVSTMLASQGDQIFSTHSRTACATFAPAFLTLQGLCDKIVHAFPMNPALNRRLGRYLAAVIGLGVGTSPRPLILGLIVALYPSFSPPLQLSDRAWELPHDPLCAISPVTSVVLRDVLSGC